MITMPAGSFDMGSRSEDIRNFVGGFQGFLGGNAKKEAEQEQLTEQPVHRVDLDRAFAISRAEITVGQFGQFVRATNYQTDAERRGNSIAHLALGDSQIEELNWRHDFMGETNSMDAAVIHVSYNDAVAFTQWLSGLAQARYRLPTESEFEYATKAGINSIYPWGSDRPPNNYGNFRGALDAAPDGWGRGKPKPPIRALKKYSDGAFGPAVEGKYTLNPFGLDNMMGNLSEWTQDCYFTSYSGKLGTQNARELPGCTQRVLRGTSWATGVRKLRASWREGRAEDYSASTIGFRVVREINIPNS